MLKKKKPNKYTQSKGQVPGTLIYTGEKSKNKFSIEVLKYNNDTIEEKKFSTSTNVTKFLDHQTIAWINVNGLNHTGHIQTIGNHLNLHPILQEDIVNIHQRPKIEEYDDYIFITLKMLSLNKRKKIVNEQLSIILTKENVITFQEAEGDVFDNVRERLRQKKGRIRSLSTDYLCYALIDAIVDYYFDVIEALENKIELLENTLFKDNPTNKNITSEIQHLKRDIINVRRAVFPLREVINRLSKNDSALIAVTTKDYIKDVRDHIIQVTENIDLYREMIWSLMDMHMSTLSNKNNEVMKVLTIVATIFIPLTFIVGIYGMNFKNMPELHTDSGYYVVLIVMVLVVIAMAAYFKQKKWL